MNTPCPDREILSRYHDHELTFQELSRWKAHLEACPTCLQVLQEYDRASGFDPQTPEAADEGFYSYGKIIEQSLTSFRRRGNRVSEEARLRFPKGVLRVASLAACALLAVGIAAGAGWFGDSPSNADMPRFSDSAEEHTFSRTLGDGTRLQWGKGTQWRASAPGRLRLDDGILSVEVPEGALGLRIETPAGTIRDIGTVFRVQAFRYTPFHGGEPVAAAFVEVTDGAVEMNNDKVVRTVPAGMKGYLIDGLEPSIQDLSSQVAVRPEDVLGLLQAEGAADSDKHRFRESLLVMEVKRHPERLEEWQRRINPTESYKAVLTWLRKQVE